jgi:tetratricopeptide (TPR) repeat protein
MVRELLAGWTDGPDLAAARARGFDYGAAFQAAGRAVDEPGLAVGSERSEAPELLREIAVQPFYRQWLLVTDHPRFRTWSFCGLLLDACREWGFQDPPRALQAARLGVQIADRLDRERYGEARVNDLRARAWATLGNAERILTDFRAAEKSFAQAERLLKSGTGDPVELALFLLFEASLLGHQQRFAKAFRQLDRVVRLGRLAGDLHLCGKALITRGFLAGMAHEHELSLRLLREGLPLVDPEAEPRLLLAAYHNLILGLTESGNLTEAGELLEHSGPLYERLGDRMNLIRRTWLEGKIALGRGELPHAESLLLGARTQLTERELGYDAALLSLDLAQVYARQGRGAEMRKLAEEMLPIFQSRAIRREAVSALIVFQKAAAMERVTLGIVQELSDSLQESRSTPGLRLRDLL